MPRPATKSDLIETANEQFEKLWSLIDTMTEDEQNTAFNFGDNAKEKEAHWKRDKNLRDILIHLYEWHQLLLNFVSANKNGEKKPFLPEPYNWKNLWPYECKVLGEASVHLLCRRKRNADG